MGCTREKKGRKRRGSVTPGVCRRLVLVPVVGADASFVHLVVIILANPGTRDFRAHRDIDEVSKAATGFSIAFSEAGLDHCRLRVLRAQHPHHPLVDAGEAFQNQDIALVVHSAAVCMAFGCQTVQ